MVSYFLHGLVAKSVDAVDSKSAAREGVPVRVRPRPPSMVKFLVSN